MMAKRDGRAMHASESAGTSMKCAVPSSLHVATLQLPPKIRRPSELREILYFNSRSPGLSDIDPRRFTHGTRRFLVLRMTVESGTVTPRHRCSNASHAYEHASAPSLARTRKLLGQAC